MGNRVSKTGSKKKKRTHLKVVMVGDGAVGKTCLLITHCYGTFPGDYIPTFYDNFSFRYEHPEHGTVEVGLWDTAGQEDYDRLRPLCYPQTDAFCLCFSVSSRTSFMQITEKWVPEIAHYCPDVPCILVGMKGDHREDSKVIKYLEQRNQDFVTAEEANLHAHEIGAVTYVECSALNQNTKHVFVEAVNAAFLENPPRIGEAVGLSVKKAR